MNAQTANQLPPATSVVPPDLRSAGWRVRRDNEQRKFYAENEHAGLRTELFDKDVDAVSAARDLQAEHDGAPSEAEMLAAHQQRLEDQAAEVEAEVAAADGRDNLPPAGQCTATTLLDPELIRTDGGTQARATLNDATVEDYSQSMRAGEVFPPVVVFYDGTDYWLGDGFHRHEATLRAELTEIAADVRQGTRRDAVLYAVGANARHGLRRTEVDKHRAVETLLRDEEWSKWSNREIARRCQVTHTFVGTVRAELSGHRSQMEATAKRGGREYIVRTEKIGSTQKAKQTPAEDLSMKPRLSAAEAYSGQSPHSSEESSQGSTAPTSTRVTQQTTASAPASQAPALQVTAEPDPEGWDELDLAIHLAIKKGKSLKRGITISGRAGEGMPLFRTDFTAADLEPMPPALAALFGDLKKDFAKTSSKVAAARHAEKAKGKGAPAKRKAGAAAASK